MLQNMYKNWNFTVFCISFLPLSFPVPFFSYFFLPSLSFPPILEPTFFLLIVVTIFLISFCVFYLPNRVSVILSLQYLLYVGTNCLGFVHWCGCQCQYTVLSAVHHSMLHHGGGGGFRGECTVLGHLLTLASHRIRCYQVL